METTHLRRLLRSRRHRRRVTGFAALVLAVGVISLGSSLRKGSRHVVGLLTADVHHNASLKQGLVPALEFAFERISQLRAEVEDTGAVIQDYGKRAEQVMNEAVQRAGPASGRDVQVALDVVLQTLFLRQASLLADQVVLRHHGQHGPQHVAKLEEEFLSELSALVRPGSGWTAEFERARLRDSVGRGLRSSAALLEIRARQGQLQQATVAAIARLQGMIETLALKLQQSSGRRAPWVLSTSYRIPKTPLQFVGKYDNGRADIQLNLSPEKNPSKTKGGSRLNSGPATIGASFDVGMPRMPSFM